MINRVVITRPSGPYTGAKRFAKKLIAAGFDCLELPVLACKSIALTDPLRHQIKASLSDQKRLWLGFVSPTSVWVWDQIISEDAELAEATGRALLGAQGGGTAAAILECFGRKPDFIPAVFVAEEFAREFAAVLKAGDRLFVPQSADGRDVLAPTLVAMGKDVLSINTYQLEAVALTPEEIEAYRRFVTPNTAILFMSPSAVQATLAGVGGVLGSDKVVSIGPITSQAILSAGLHLWRQAQDYSEDGVLAVLR